MSNQLTGWHRFQAVKIGGHYLAAAEWFEKSRPVPEADRVGTIRVGRGATPELAGAALEALLA
jgi:hypothetical protein